METLAYIITLIIFCVIFYIAYRFIGKNSTQDILNKTNLIFQYAGAFVAWAKQFKSTLSGSEKMDLVVEKLIDIANKNDIDITEIEIKAIVQQAYNTMKNAEESIKNKSSE